MVAGTVRIMDQNLACDWQMLTVSMVDTTIWVAELLEGLSAAAVHRLNAHITVQGLISQGDAALSAYLPPAERMMHLSYAGLCAKHTAISWRHASSCWKGAGCSLSC